MSSIGPLPSQQDDGDDYQEQEPPTTDFPSDDFDRALLAEVVPICPTPNRGESERLSLASRMLERRPNHSRTDYAKGLLDASFIYASSSSPSHTISSPTVSILRNRHVVNQRSSTNGELGNGSVIDEDVIFSIPKSEQQITTNLPLLRLPHAPPIIQGIQLVTTAKLPDRMRSIFKFPLFNAVQSRCFPHAFQGNDNLVVAAPTGSGKTAILELAICQLLISKTSQDFKVVYQAPTRSLCAERQRDWDAKFRPLGLTCAELTGDVELANVKNVQKADIIITTPEKWDSITRKWKDNIRLMRMIKLFLVDEVHILREARGATLEAVVARMKSIGSSVRFVALSATVPNSEDIAAWLGLNPCSQDVSAVREVFGEEFRPTKLEKHVIGFNGPPNEYVLDGMLVKEVPAVIARYSNRKPVMIFCPTQKSAIKMARSLSDLWLASSKQSQLWNGPQSEISVQDSDLRKTVHAAVAFHHGGLDAADRSAVERGFLEGGINIICSTSTLAVGVNLPCYLVILKGTSCYTDSGLQEYTILEVIQMLGRAGRPQFESSACAVILTSREKVARYEKLVSGQELLESSLHENLIEHLNAEIGLGTIKDLCTAIKWLSSTFLYVRLQRNPDRYKMDEAGHFGRHEELLEIICEKNLRLLHDADLIYTDGGYHSTDYGHAMARYYVKFETMRTLLKLPPHARMNEILENLTLAVEFKELRWRPGEKGFYKKINKSNDTRFPIKVDVALPSHKASLLIQVAMGSYMLAKEDRGRFDLHLQQDTKMVLSHCSRLIRCIIDVQISRQDSTSTMNALELARSFGARVWDGTAMQLKQIGGVGDITARRLAAGGITSIDKLSTAESHQIELILGKNPPFGSNLLAKLDSFPTLRISIKENHKKRGPSGGAEINFACEIAILNDRIPSFFNRKFIYICFLCETSYGKLIDFRRFGANQVQHMREIPLKTTIDRTTSKIIGHVMCDEIAGTHRCAELKVDVPEDWLQNHKEGNRQTGDGIIDVYSTRSNLADNFQDADFLDSDFLGAETNTCTPAIQISDDIVTHHHVTSAQKRKAEIVSESEEASKYSHVPAKLPNSNWTCRHQCVAQGKMCKHLCCKDGIRKPNKRSKATHNAGSHDIVTGSVACDTACKSSFVISQHEDHAKNGSQFSLDGVMNAKEVPQDFEFQYSPKRDKDSHSDLLPTSKINEFDCDFDFFNLGTFDMGELHPDHDASKVAASRSFDTEQQMNREWSNTLSVASTNQIEDVSTSSSAKPLHGVKPRNQNRNLVRPQSVQPSISIIPKGDDNEDEKFSKSAEVNNELTENFRTFAGTEDCAATSTKTPVGDAVPAEKPRNKNTKQVRITDHDKCLLEHQNQSELDRMRIKHDGEQKQKWAQLEPWMYEQFASYVDII